MSGDASLAAERTTLAWQRTALAHLGAGAVVVRFVPSRAVGVPLGAVLVVLGLVAAVVPSARIGRPRGRPILLLAAGTTAAALGALGAAFFQSPA